MLGMHHPIKDPRTFYEKRVAGLREQLSGTEISLELESDLHILEITGEEFRNNEISAETVCYSAMRAYWLHQQEIKAGTQASYNLVTLGHDFGFYAELPFQYVKDLFEAARVADHNYIRY